MLLSMFDYDVRRFHGFPKGFPIFDGSRSLGDCSKPKKLSRIIHVLWKFSETRCCTAFARRGNHNYTLTQTKFSLAAYYAKCNKNIRLQEHRNPFIGAVLGVFKTSTATSSFQIPVVVLRTSSKNFPWFQSGLKSVSRG